MSLATFQKLRPENVLTMSHRKHYQCVCEVCTNVDIKIEAWNKAAIKHKKPDMKIRDRYELAETTMCECAEGEEHKMSCITRQCPHCGVQKFRDVYNALVQESPAEDLMTWSEVYWSMGV